MSFIVTLVLLHEMIQILKRLILTGPEIFNSLHNERKTRLYESQYTLAEVQFQEREAENEIWQE